MKIRDLKRDLKSIAKNGRPRADCPQWYAEGIEQGDFAYQTETGWKLTERGAAELHPTTHGIDVSHF